MELNEVFSQLKKRSKAVTGKAFKGSLLVEKMGIPKDRFYGWNKGSMPTDSEDIKNLEKLLGVTSIKNIPDDFLSDVKIIEIQNKLENWGKSNNPNLMMPDDFYALDRIMTRWRHYLETPHPTDRIYKTIATDSPIIALANLMRRVDEIEDRLDKDDE